jgi:hypothetical protein
MTVLQTAYDTTACKDFQMGKTTAAILVAMTHGQLTPLEDSNEVFLVQGGSSVVDAIPAFAHPLMVKEVNSRSGNDGELRNLVILDTRQYGKWNQDQNVFTTRSHVEYNLAIHRARLTAIWLKENQTILRDISPVPMAVFAMWISEAVAKRFALDPRQQFDLAILASIYYCSQFNDDNKLHESEMRMVKQITSILKASAQDVLAVVEKVSIITSLTHFCSMAEEVTGSVRLKELSPGFMFAIMGNTWFGGSNAKELACVAIEHPPTWISILMQAVSERSYKNTAIAKITERNAFRDTGKSMLRAVLNLEQSIEH